MAIIKYLTTDYEFEGETLSVEGSDLIDRLNYLIADWSSLDAESRVETWGKMKKLAEQDKPHG